MRKKSKMAKMILWLLGLDLAILIYAILAYRTPYSLANLINWMTKAILQ